MEILYAIISWTVFGAIIGGIARLLMPGEQDLGCLLTVVLGVVGSYVGGFVSSLFTGRIALDHPAGWIMSIVGAIVVLFIAEMIMKKRSPPPEV